MENKKNGENGIYIAIIIVLLGIIAFCAYKIGTTGRCVVDDANLQKGGNTSVPVEDVTNDTKEVTTATNTTSKNVTTVADTISRFIGKYKFEFSGLQNDNLGENEPCNKVSLFVNLELKNDGTFDYSRGASCSSGDRSSGVYLVGHDAIYLYNEKCVGLNEPCSLMIKLKYIENNGKIDLFDNDSKDGWAVGEKFGNIQAPSETKLTKVN